MKEERSGQFNWKLLKVKREDEAWVVGIALLQEQRNTQKS